MQEASLSSFKRMQLSYEGSDCVDIRALSIGIGLGELRSPRGRRTYKMPVEKTKALANTRSQIWEFPTTAVEKPPRVRVIWSLDWLSQLGALFAFLRVIRPKNRDIAHGLDALIVAFSCLLVFVVTGWWLSGGNETSGLEWLSELQFWEILSGFVGIFLIYFLLFRIVAGVTLGETLFAGVKAQFEKKKTEVLF